MTPVTVRRSALGRIAAVVLVLLIVSPFTAPFSVMTGELQASPGGPADSLQNETTQAPAVVEVAFVHVDPPWSLVRFPTIVSTRVVDFAHVNRVLRL